MRTRPLLVTTLAGLALLVAGCGSETSDSGVASGTRSVDIDMRDNTCSPDRVSVSDGEMVRFMFHNTGAVSHDALMGDAAVQDRRDTDMRSAGGMSNQEDAVTVRPGRTRTLTERFHDGDQVMIGCHRTGHHGAAMRIAVDVE